MSLAHQTALDPQSALVPTHPAANMLPMMTDSEIAELAADIYEHRLIESVFSGPTTPRKRRAAIGAWIAAHATCSTGARVSPRSTASACASTPCSA